MNLRLALLVLLIAPSVAEPSGCSGIGVKSIYPTIRDWHKWALEIERGDSSHLERLVCETGAAAQLTRHNSMTNPDRRP